MPSRPLLHKNWTFRPVDESVVLKLSKELNLSPLWGQILLNRQIQSAEEGFLFLNPSLNQLMNPFLMKGMQEAVRRLEKAILQKEKVVIYGDYDVDGTTSSSLLFLFLTEIGCTPEVYIPHRVKEGYGLNQKAIEKLAHEGTKLIVTVDNGTSSVIESAFAKKLGVEMIIADHHQPPSELPEVVALLNPKQSDCLFPYKELAAVGVTFFLLIALRSHLRESGFFSTRPEPNLKRYLDLVAVGTVADMVPLTGQNRILVQSGLKVLSETENKGLIALKEVAKTDGKITPGQIGFRLGPRINAVGRLESAQIGFQLLTSQNLDQARQLARQLDEANHERQLIEEQIVEEASERVEREEIPQKRRSIVLYDPSWHLGVIGIVASRMVERYYLPSIVGNVENGKIRCSARSISGFDLYEGLKTTSRHLTKFGGHKYAAGLSLQENEAAPFWESFDQHVQQTVSKEQFVPSLKVDAEYYSKDSMDFSWLEMLEKMGPFGQGNPEPVFLMRQTRVKNMRIVGEKHLKVSFESGGKLFDAIGFGMANQLDDSSSLDIPFSVQLNEWNGERRLQLKLVDLPKKSDQNNLIFF